MTTDLTATLPPERTDATVLEFTDVTKTFADGTHALASTSLTVAPGEFVTIVGPSGCGKSTLLRIASGLDAPTTGTVSVDRSSLGYVFQDPTLLQWRTVRRNVELFAELEGVDRAERARRVADNVRLVGLEGFEDKYPKQLSGGMKMRASLARSLLMEPAMFLFDEPFGALDEITRERLNDELLGAVPAQGLRRPVHHPLDLRGRVPVDPGARHVGATGPAHRRVRRAVRLSPLARPALRAGVRRAVRRGQPHPARERTHDASTRRPDGRRARRRRARRCPAPCRTRRKMAGAGSTSSDR